MHCRFMCKSDINSISSFDSKLSFMFHVYFLQSITLGLQYCE